MFASLEGVVAALVGLTGYRSIMRRALHRTAQDFALLSTLDALPPQFPSLGWDLLLERADSERVQACATALLVNTLGSLCDLLGADLTLRLIETVWQGLPAERSLGTATDRTH